MCEILNCWKQEFLVIDFDHALLANTIAEELILYGITTCEIAMQISEYFKEFKQDFELTQSLLNLSGGEQAIIVTIIYSALAIHKNKPVKLLLNNILESLSDSNKKKLLNTIKTIDPDNLIQVFQLINDIPHECN